MELRTFEAIDMKHALARVREEFGPNAVIVSSRTVRRQGRLFGVLGRKVLEVTAAVEEPTRSEPPTLRGPISGDLAATRAAAAGPGPRGAALPELRAVKQVVDPVLDEVRSIREQIAGLDQRVAPTHADVLADLSQIRGLLASLVGSGAVAADAEGTAAQRVFYFLLARGIDEPLARSLVQRIVSRVDSGALGDVERLKLNLAAEMRADLFRTERGAPPGRVQVFAGPTGVGKTTTIAKLAARASRASPGSALVVTTDVHRVAAVEQMVRFGEMIEVPVEVAIGPQDLARTLAAHPGVERVFVDTPGRSHRDPGMARALRGLLDAVPEAELMLVLATTMRAADSREILQAYASLPVSRLVMTKLDETRVYGELYNCAVRSGRPIACVTTGQGVPEHLESLDIPGVLRKVLQG
jgi:flagellar biosynthesis protein FlhF